MTSVWFASTGSGEDGDPWDVRDVFATRELAEAYCNRPDKPRWEHAYVQEWEVEGSLLTDEEREAVLSAACYFDTRADLRMQAFGSTLRVMLERLT